MRYDDFVIFYNHSTQDFVGRYSSEDGTIEDYLIPAGGKELFPTWLANHFAKRLCDREMILKNKRPGRSDDPERIEFMQKCLIDPKVDTTEQKTTFKQQIEEDRNKILRDSSGKFSKKQLKELRTLDKEEEKELQESYAESLKGPKIQRQELSGDQETPETEPIEFVGSAEQASTSLQSKIPKP